MKVLVIYDKQTNLGKGINDAFETLLPGATITISDIREYRIITQLPSGGSAGVTRYFDQKSDYDLIISFEDINTLKEIRFNKPKGSILILTNYSETFDEINSIMPIFEIGGNGVLLISVNNHIKLLDALGNVWYEGHDTAEALNAIIDLYHWAHDAKRVSSTQIIDDKLSKFIQINRELAEKVERANGRYFGNCSTRCSHLFPTMNNDNGTILVSKRNVSKKTLTSSDMIAVKLDKEDGHVLYFGEEKPSVDTPIHCQIYKSYPEIKYMIHGHTYIRGARYTENYYPCGDLRELGEIKKLIGEGVFGMSGRINLINHGFLIYAKDLTDLNTIVSQIQFDERPVGFEPIIRITEEEYTKAKKLVELYEKRRPIKKIQSSGTYGTFGNNPVDPPWIP